MTIPHTISGFLARAVYPAGKVLSAAALTSAQGGLLCPPPGRVRVLQDTTVLGIGGATDSDANARRGIPVRAVHHADEDALLARLLITSRSLATGRTLRSDAAPQSLTEEELISFWADDAIGIASHTGPA